MTYTPKWKWRKGLDYQVRTLPEWRPWDGKELKQFYDKSTGEYFTSWEDQYGQPSVLREFNYDTYRGKPHDFMTVEQKTVIVECILLWRIDGQDKFDVARTIAKPKMPRLPGQWPLTHTCVAVWDGIRQREIIKGNFWPFRSREEFLSAGQFSEDDWYVYANLNQLLGILPSLGIPGRGRELRRIMNYRKKIEEQNLRLYQRDESLYTGGRKHGSIRQRMWYELLVAAKEYLIAKRDATHPIDPDLRRTRYTLRGLAIGYAVFVDPYSYNDPVLRPDVLKTIERKACDDVRSRARKANRPSTEAG